MYEHVITISVVFLVLNHRSTDFTYITPTSCDLIFKQDLVIRYLQFESRHSLPIYLYAINSSVLWDMPYRKSTRGVVLNVLWPIE